MDRSQEMLAKMKLPPQALEAEQSLLGGLLLENQKWDEVIDEVRADDFYQQNHQLIFKAIAGLQQADQPADIITVAEWMEKGGELEKIGGLSYISALANNTPGAANAVSYAKIVRECAILRKLIAAANEIASTAYERQGKTPREVLDFAQQQVLQITEQEGRSDFMEIKALTAQTLEWIERLSESDSEITGVATGFADIDRLTSGLQRGDLVVVAGRPSMGKTAFALNIAEYVAVEQQMPVAVFSMEMSGEQLAMRLLSSMGRIDSNQLRKGKIRDQDWSRLASTGEILSKTEIYVDDSPGLGPLELRARARRLWRKHNKKFGLLVVDYLQLMDASGSSETRANEIAVITRALKMLAKEMDVPVMALSQLNRAVEQRPDKRPMMADLRESGAIEQDADVIMFIYRDEVYDPQSEHKGTADIIIGKQRNGPIGTVRMAFLGQFTRFEDLAPDAYGGADS